MRIAGFAVILGLAACEDAVVYRHAPFSTDPANVGSLRGRIVTTNNGDDTLSVLDPQAPGPAGRLPVGLQPVDLEGPHHGVADPAGRFVYVNFSMAVQGAGGGPHGSHGMSKLYGFVQKLDAVTTREVARAYVDPSSGDIAISPDGRWLYVTHYDVLKWTGWQPGMPLEVRDSRLVVIDAERMAVTARVPMCPAAHGVRLSADGAQLYATCGPDMIAVVSTRDFSVTRVQIPGTVDDGASCRRCPYAIGVAPDGLVWVSSLGPSGGFQGRGGIDVFDPATMTFDVSRRVDLRGSALFATFAPDGAGGFVAYVPEQGATGDFLRVYGPAPLGQPPPERAALPFSRDTCLAAHQLLVSADGRRGWLVCEGDHVGPGSFVWLDLAGLGVIGSTPVGVFPDGLVLVPGP